MRLIVKVLVISFLCILLGVQSSALALNTYQYQYDSNNRLLNIMKDGFILYEFLYDANGNLLTMIRNREAPKDLQASNITHNALLLTWTGIPYAIKYKVYRNGNYLAEASTTSYQVTGLTSGTNYTFTVSAVFSSGEGPQSPPLSVTTRLAPPIALNATNINESSFTLLWSYVIGAERYKIYQNGN